MRSSLLTSGRPASSPTAACPNRSLLAIRVWQVQRFSPMPVCYKVALQAAICHWDNFQAAVAKAGELSCAPPRLLAEARHMHACEHRQASSPLMCGGMHSPRTRTVPSMPLSAAPALELLEDGPTSPPRRRPRLSWTQTERRPGQETMLPATLLDSHFASV